MSIETKNTRLELPTDQYHIRLGISDIEQLPNLDTIHTIVNGKEVNIKIPDIQ